MQNSTWQIPNWWYRHSRPTSDNAYFENLCRIIFQTGLNWHVVDKKWENIKHAFCNFDIDSIADFNDHDIDRLLSDKRIIRNKYKIHAIITNAKIFKKITKNCGSFKAYIDKMDKADNYQKVVAELADTFERIGPTTASLFLFSVGEKIKPTRIY